MFLRRLKMTKVTFEQKRILEQAKQEQEKAKETLEEVKAHAQYLKERREVNHFTEGLARAMGA